MFIANRCVPGYRLVVAANRDEFHSRATAKAHYWEETPELLAGRDLEAGGTWLGVTIGGRFAALTNYSGPRSATVRSRGFLVSEFLQNKDIATAEYLADVQANAGSYNGFNLLVDDGEYLGIVSNFDLPARTLKPGIYGLGNHSLDIPWPKVQRGKRLFAQLLSERAPDPMALLALMDDRRQPDEDESVTYESPTAFSSMFIEASTYGTRSISVLAFRDDGNGWFAERCYDCASCPVATQRFDLKQTPPARMHG